MIRSNGEHKVSRNNQVFLWAKGYDMAHHPNHVARVLVKVALKPDTITYTQLGKALGRTGSNPGRGLGPDLDRCQDWLKKHDLPPLTVLVVQKSSGMPSPDGTFFGRTFGDMTDEEIAALQRECFEYAWTAGQLKALGPSPNN